MIYYSRKRLDFVPGTAFEDSPYLENAKLRFLNNVDMGDTDYDCWIWTGATTFGYGTIRFAGKRWLAHKWIYRLMYGKMNTDYVIAHICNKRRCVNILHLKEVTRETNVQEHFLWQSITAFANGRRLEEIVHELDNKELQLIHEYLQATKAPL